MPTKLKIPRGFKVVPFGQKKRRGDKFMNAYGEWVLTAEWGVKVDLEHPHYTDYPQYAGIYIRPTKKKATK